MLNGGLYFRRSVPQMAPDRERESMIAEVTNLINDINAAIGPDCFGNVNSRAIDVRRVAKEAGVALRGEDGGEFRDATRSDVRRLVATREGVEQLRFYIVCGLISVEHGINLAMKLFRDAIDKFNVAIEHPIGVLPLSRKLSIARDAVNKVTGVFNKKRLVYIRCEHGSDRVATFLRFIEGQRELLKHVMTHLLEEVHEIDIKMHACGVRARRVERGEKSEESGSDRGSDRSEDVPFCGHQECSMCAFSKEREASA